MMGPMKESQLIEKDSCELQNTEVICLFQFASSQGKYFESYNHFSFCYVSPVGIGNVMYRVFEKSSVFFGEIFFAEGIVVCEIKFK